MLALSAGISVLAPGIDVGKNANEGDGIELSWPGTSAHAKRRRKGNDDGNGTTYGSFSSGTSSSNGGQSWSSSSNSNSNSSSNSNAPASSNSNSPTAPNGSDSNNARSDNNSGSNRSSSGDRRKDDDQNGNGSGNSGPPATVADTLKSLFDNGGSNGKSGSGANATPSTNANSSKSSLGAPSTPAAPNPVTPTAKGPRGVPVSGGSANVDIGSNTHAAGELLGVRLNSKAVEALQGMGFAVPSQPKTGFDVLLLTTPPGMSSDAAQAMLRQAMPKDKFETNKYYRNQPRSGTGSAHSVTNASPSLACTGSRCAPRELIKWSPENLKGCSSGVAVGVLDTGLDVAHPTFTRPITNSFIPEGRLPAPTWHGTAVFALLAGNQKSGTPGLIPNATLYHGNVFYADAAGEFATDTHVLLSALDWMDRANVKIVNMSFAGPRDQLMEEAIAKLSAKGMVFVAAVGNEGPTAEPAYPAAYRHVIAVTAIKSDRRIYPFANRGRHIDVAAPGVDIWSAVPGAREGYYTGTSFATPFVTAMVASIYRENPTPVKEKLLARLDYDDLGLPGRDSTYGRGLAIAPRNCAPAPLVAETPAPPPNWGTTSVDKASTRPSATSTISSGFR